MKILEYSIVGPQEVSQSQHPAAQQQPIVNDFWIELEKRVINAKEAGALVGRKCKRNETIRKSR